MSGEAEAYASELVSVFGRNFRRSRRAAEISQGLIADRYQIARNTIVQIERGKGNPSLMVLAKLALAVGCEVPAMLMKKTGPGGTGD